MVLIVNTEVSPMAERSGRERRRRVAAAKSGLRDLRIELEVLNHRVGSRVELKDIDFDCLDVIARHGPLTPTALAGRVGVHLATMTGILNRLETGGWITRDRAANDRRAVVVASTPDRQRELYGLFDAMNSRLDEICRDYSDDELDTIIDFLARTVAAGRMSSDDLA
jgi:DNA-binding MarR family transcriptional regulator